MTTRPVSEPSDQCPYLVPIVVDSLWLRPLGVYCRRPGQAVRVPAESTVARVCSGPAYDSCEGYRMSTTALEVPVVRELP